ncbi:retron Ec48 family effector membrane protein [Pseudomonas aeruginosa]|uniref:retron Ec48 family effector membrane protein n=1 Tax=Pseudomonas aeruginosa TaxID=287 RepID=UPI000FC42235|nr:retron Ec48 family effector membrane protein [Pseudomonas aeruginosa]RUC69069.1 hypothetical protein IPC1380_23260 [Pseudomonas aeruginosa]
MIDRISNRYNFPRSLAALIFWGGIIFLGGAVTAFCIFVPTYLSGDFYSRPFCLTNSCIKHTFEAFDQVIVVFWAAVQILVAFATIGGIFVALTNYLEVNKTNALAAHLSQFSNFQSYVTLQIERRDQLAISSFDILAWYNSIFPFSRKGNLVVSGDYVRQMQSLADVVVKSNSAILGGMAERFSYVEHQKSVIAILSEIGITVERYHRKQWCEIEDEVFALIDMINKTFCLESKISVLPVRRYL